MPDNPTNEPVATQPNQNQPDPSNALFKKAGGDWNKASDSYFNAVSELGKTHDQLNMERAERGRLEAMVQAAMGGKAVNQNPFSELDSLGISSEAIQRELERTAQAIVDEKLGTLFSPIVTQMEAEEQLASEIDDFDQHKSAARSFMKQNPEVGEVFKNVLKANPVAAWKYAIRETLIAKQAQPERKSPPSQPSGRTPSQRGQEVNQTLGADHQANEAAAVQYLHQFGDSAPYRHERFKGTSIERAVKAAMRQVGYDNE